MNVGVSLAGNLLFDENADLSDPEYRALLAEQLEVEGVAYSVHSDDF